MKKNDKSGLVSSVNQAKVIWQGMYWSWILCFPHVRVGGIERFTFYVIIYVNTLYLCYKDLSVNAI